MEYLIEGMGLNNSINCGIKCDTFGNDCSPQCIERCEPKCPDLCIVQCPDLCIGQICYPIQFMDPI